MPILVAAGSAKQQALCRSLAEAGLPGLITASSAAEATEILALCDPFAPLSPFDLILLDHSLPDADLLSLCHRIRNRDQSREVSIVILTDEHGVPGPVESFHAGATEWVSGEVGRPEALARIRRALELKLAASRQRNERQQYDEDLALARKVQRGVLSPPYYTDSIEIDAAYVPSQSLSGDMYYWCQISPGRYGVLLTDVMGHGLSASLVCMALRTVMHGLVTRVVDPVKVLDELERHIRILRPNSATALYVVIDTITKTVEYANAGHPPGLLLQASGRVDLLERTAVPLGFDLAVRPRKQVLPLESPARIVLYTDGLVEERGRSIRVGIDTLKQQLVELQRQGTRQFIASTIMGFNKLLETSDDVTLIAISLLGPGKS